ncbi:MAG: hypothetical protein ACYC26_17735 [Phycisphaerales bacterium]
MIRQRAKKYRDVPRCRVNRVSPMRTAGILTILPDDLATHLCVNATLRRAPGRISTRFAANQPDGGPHP